MGEKQKYWEALQKYFQTKSAFMPADPAAAGGMGGMGGMGGAAGPMPGGDMGGGAGPMPGGMMPGGDMGMGGMPPDLLAGLGGMGGFGGMMPPMTGMGAESEQGGPGTSEGESKSEGETIGNLTEDKFKELLKSSVSDAFDRTAADLTSAITDLKQELRSLKDALAKEGSPSEEIGSERNML